jgi:uncharacterized protein YkwD
MTSPRPRTLMLKLLMKAQVLVVVVACTVAACGAAPRSLPPYPREKNTAEAATASRLQEKARRLFDLAHNENSGLNWDECLGQRAAERARKMFVGNYFDHQDPKTGKKPAWDLVSSCHRCRYAGENLTRGHDRPEAVHQALMDSPTHRKNILSARFTRLGVGCYENICVQLFAGF